MTGATRDAKIHRTRLGEEEKGGRCGLEGRSRSGDGVESRRNEPADDNQSAVTVHVLQGERERASANKSLGRFDLADIPPAPRGTPQIEVTFDIDANGIMHVSAKNKSTGKEQSIVIKASSGLSDEEIEKMVRDAEANAEDDKKFHELVNSRNHADSSIHSTEKAMKDAGDKLPADERSRIQSSIDALKAAMKTDNKDDIDSKTKDLTDAAAKLAEFMQAGASGASAQAGSEQAQSSAHTHGDDVVDAEFEEVKDDEKK